MGYGAGEPIKFPNNNDIKLPLVGIGHKTIQLWPRVLCPADSFVSEFANNLPTPALAVFP
jgi:hypothetical protein